MHVHTQHSTHTFCLRCMTRLAQPRSDLIRVHTEPICIFPTHMHTPPRPQSWQVCYCHPFSFRWRAGNHSAFWGMTLDEGIRYRLGTIRPSSSVTNMNEIHVSPSLSTMLPSPWHPVPYSSKGLGLYFYNRLCVSGQVTPLLWAFENWC